MPTFSKRNNVCIKLSNNSPLTFGKFGFFMLFLKNTISQSLQITWKFRF